MEDRTVDAFFCIVFAILAVLIGYSALTVSGQITLWLLAIVTVLLVLGCAIFLYNALMG